MTSAVQELLEGRTMDPIIIHDRGRGPELAGTRTTVYDVIPYWLRSRDVQYIASALGREPRQIEALIRYIEEHHDEVMTVHQQIEARVARGNPPEIEEKLKQSTLHQRLQARWEEIQRRRQEGEDGEGASVRQQHPGAPEGSANGTGK
jgi:hypothetical protein